MKWLDTLSERAQNLLASEREFQPESEDRRQRVLARARATLRHAEAPQRGMFWLRPARLLAPALVLMLATLSYAAWRRTQRAAESPSVVETTPAKAAITAPPPAPKPSVPAATSAPPELRSPD